MPSLATRPQYQQQFSDRVAELLMQLAGLQHQIAGGRLDLEPAAERCRREIAWITALVEVPA
jgi:ribosomal protein L29